jgi:steroid 5-alpha reductase family enzyme
MSFSSAGIVHRIVGSLPPADTRVFLSLATCAGAMLVTYIASILTRNYSQVDKLWSILPAVYVVIFVSDGRTMLLAAVVLVWSVRLTYNFHRRGGYVWPPWQGEEDYRWEYIQSGKFLPVLANPVAWSLFNFLFISVYQNILLLWIATPAMVAHFAAAAAEDEESKIKIPLHAVDWVIALLGFACIAVEAVADNQQFAFQTEKKRRLATPQTQPLTYDLKDGFCQTGLFAILRKPNYAAEQAFWFTVYLFGVSATGQWANFSLPGCVLLSLLFQGSGWFTEKLSLEKYPAYAAYQRRVPLYVPSLSACRRRRRRKSKAS